MSQAIYNVVDPGDGEAAARQPNFAKMGALYSNLFHSPRPQNANSKLN
jgi:hypothetical protein